MRTRFLEKLFRLTQRRSGWILALMALVALAAAALIPGIKVSSSYSSMAPAGHPEGILYANFQQEFGSDNDYVVVLEGEPEDTRDCADLLAAAIRNNNKGLVSDIYYKVDLKGMLANAPLYLDSKTLHGCLKVAMESESAIVASLRGADGLPSLLHSISRGARGEQVSAQVLGQDQQAASIQQLDNFFAEWHHWLEDHNKQTISVDAYINNTSQRNFANEGAAQQLRQLVNSNGYLASYDGDLQFLFVKPSLARDDKEFLESVDHVIQDAWRMLQQAHPELTGRVRFGTTGFPAHVLTDIRSVQSDITRVLVPSAVLVVVILLLGLGSIRRALLALVTLTFALIIAGGVMRLAFDTLNRVSLSFLAMLFGIGIDFGIYLIRRTDEEFVNGHLLPESVRRALTISGRGILTGGCVTGLAFLGTGLVRYGGMAQLGQTAGVGVLVTLVVTFLLLPVLLLKFGVRGKGEPSLQVTRSPPPATDHEVNHHSGTRSKSVSKYLLVLLICLLIPAVIGGFAAPRLSLDYNILRLLPKDAESTHYQVRMQQESDFQMSAAFITADSLEEMHDLTKRVSALPEVKRVVSLTQMVPSDQREKLSLLQAHQPLLKKIADALPTNKPTATSSSTVYVRLLDELIEAFETVEETAFTTGNTGLLEGSGNILRQLAAIRSDFLQNGDTAQQRTAAFEAALFDFLARGKQLLDGWSQLNEIGENTLADSLLGRFKSAETGRYTAYVYPTGSIWELSVLDQFVASVREVTPSLTGFPVTLRTYVRLMVEDLGLALLFSLAVVVVLLLLDFRSLNKVIFTLIPLVVGMLWLQAWLWVTGQSYNLASMIALPLLLGLGVVYGVHIVHRWSENPAGGGLLAVKTSGKAIFLAGLTTIAGIVALTFSLNRAVTTFSLIILQGILCMLLAALVVLPIILSLNRMSQGREIDPPERKET